MKNRIILSAMVMTIAASLIVGATTAMLTDKETSTGNTFTAGTLDLKIDDGDSNVIKFNVDNMHPDSQPTGSYKLTNAGTLNGYLDLSKITVTNLENDLIEPEAEAGDTTLDVGELGNVVNVRLYFDNDLDGYFSEGDEMFYDGLASDLPSSIAVNKLVPAGESVTIGAKTVVDWWDTGDNTADNQAQSDTLQIDFEFLLSQKQ